MTKIIARCFMHKKDEEVTEMRILRDGFVLTLECGQIMKIFFSE